MTPRIVILCRVAARQANTAKSRTPRRLTLCGVKKFLGIFKNLNFLGIHMMIFQIFFC